MLRDFEHETHIMEHWTRNNIARIKKRILLVLNVYVKWLCYVYYDVLFNIKLLNKAIFD